VKFTEICTTQGLYTIQGINTHRWINYIHCTVRDHSLTLTGGWIFVGGSNFAQTFSRCIMITVLCKGGCSTCTVYDTVLYYINKKPQQYISTNLNIIYFFHLSWLMNSSYTNIISRDICQLCSATFSKTKPASVM